MNTIAPLTAAEKWQMETQVHYRVRESVLRFGLDQCPVCDDASGQPVKMTDWGVSMDCSECGFVRDLTSRGNA